MITSASLAETRNSAGFGENAQIIFGIVAFNYVVVSNKRATSTVEKKEKVKRIRKVTTWLDFFLSELK